MRRALATAGAIVVVATAMTSAAAHHNPDHEQGPPPPRYCVGAAKRPINPGPDGTFAGKPVHLGGYGFGSGPLWDASGLSRPPASGILPPGIFVRVLAVAEHCQHPEDALVLASIETQGYFVSYQQGPFGLHDIRREVQAATGIPARRVLFTANHSHAAPDTLGVWGGVPTEYLAFVKQQAVGAVEDAWDARQAATVWFGTADASDLVRNQFDYDPANQVVDDELRVLQARAWPAGQVLATLINLSVHTTVMGGDNTLVSADWTGPVGEDLAGIGVPIVGALGRSQPNDGPSYAACNDDQYCALDHYAGRVLAVAQQAVADAQPLRGPRVVDGHSYFISDPSHHALLFGLVYAGRPVGVPINRSLLPPWLTGNAIGTVTFSARIGDLLFSGGPGELYPQLPQTVRDAVPAGGHFVLGLAGDMLGYVIAPFPDAYPEPIRRSFFSQGDPANPTTWGFDPISNDNYFFNVSHTLGERVICSMLRGAGDVFGQGLAFWGARPQCAAFAGDAALPPGSDTLFPSVPAGF